MTDLKKTVEEQIDIILRLEDERKALLKENRLLKDKVKELSTTLTKYSLPKPAPPTSIKPSSMAAQSQTEMQESFSIHIQTDDMVNHLEEVKSLLKLIDSSKDSMSMSVLPKENDPRVNNTTTADMNITKSRRTTANDPNNEQLLEGQIIRLTKQVNTLRREVKQSVGQIKSRDKQIKELKKCVELKSEHLDKTKREFSELSQLVNTDKYKSVRLLEEELTKLRTQNKLYGEQNKKLRNQWQSTNGVSDKMKSMLESLADDYERYKQDKQSEAEGHRKRISDMMMLVDKYKEQLWAYQRNEKYLVESLRQCQERLASPAE